MRNGAMIPINIDPYLMQALKEDITSEDITTNAIMPNDAVGSAELICKQEGMIAGIDVFTRTFQLIDEEAYFDTEFKDGDILTKGDARRNDRSEYPCDPLSRTCGAQLFATHKRDRDADERDDG